TECGLAGRERREGYAKDAKEFKEKIFWFSFRALRESFASFASFASGQPAPDPIRPKDPRHETPLQSQDRRRRPARRFAEREAARAGRGQDRARASAAGR